jgi:cytochrome c oxidase subunit I
MSNITDTDHHQDHHSEGIMSWLTTFDHKKIGIMYLIASFVFFLVGGAFAMMIRAQLMHHDAQFITPDFFNQMLTMHATVMIFLAIIPALTGFGNFLLPLHLGARDVAFPRLNALGFWLFIMGGIVLLSSFAMGGAAASGWTSYPPLAGRQYSPTIGVDLWIFGLHLLGTSSIMGGLNFIVTIFNMRAPGITLHKMTLFAWRLLLGYRLLRRLFWLVPLRCCCLTATLEPVSSNLKRVEILFYSNICFGFTLTPLFIL